jgi:hypothetical protein
MTTYYKEIPTLEMRVAAARLIVVGTIGKVVSTRVDSYNHEPFVRTTYEIVVKKTLKGAAKQRLIQVEVAGGKSGAVVQSMRIPMREGDSYVMILVPQTGEKPFVPYFGSVFPVQRDGKVLLGTQTRKILSGVGARDGSITLAALRALIRGVERREAAEAKAAMAVSPGQELPPISEIPTAFDSGGHPAKPRDTQPKQKPK